MTSILFFHSSFRAHAQEGHEVRVPLVLVDIVPTAPDGSLVKDLTKDDFTIYEDGKRLGIRSLSFYSFEPRETGPAEPSIPRPGERKPRLTVVFDSMNTPKRMLDRYKSTIVERLFDLIHAGYEVMVFELTEKGKVRILQAFTTDEGLVRQAVARAAGSLWSERAQDDLAVPKFIVEQSRLGRFHMEQARQMYRAAARHRFEATLTGLLSIMNVIKDLPGRKPTLLVSGGFPDCEIDQLELAKINDPFRVLGKEPVVSGIEIFRRLIGFANSHRISFYSLYSDNFLRFVLPDIALDNFRTVAPDDFGMGTELAAIKKAEISNLAALATGTAGAAMVGADKFDDFRRTVESDLSSYYEISYVPPRETADGRYHGIKIECRRPDTRLRYRPGYFDYNEGQSAALRVASAALNPALFRDIAFSAAIVPVVTGPGRFVLWVLTALPVRGFLLDDNEGREQKAFQEDLTVFDENDSPALSFAVGTSVELTPELKDRLMNARHFGFNSCSQEVKLKNAEYRAVVSLYDRDSGTMGTEERTFEISDPSKEDPGSILTAVFGKALEQAGEGPEGFSFSQKNGTLRFQRYLFFPQALNDLDRVGMGHLFVQVRESRPGGKPDLRFSVEVESGEAVEIQARALAGSEIRKARIRNVLYELDLSPLSPGEHALLISGREEPAPGGPVLSRLAFRLR